MHGVSTLTTSGTVTIFYYICITHEYNDDDEVGGLVTS